MSVYVAELFLTCTVDPDDPLNPEATLVLLDQRWTQPLARAWSRLVIDVPDDATFMNRLNALIRGTLLDVIKGDFPPGTVNDVKDTFLAGIWKPGQGGIHIGYASIYADVAGQDVPWRIPAPNAQYGYVSAAVTWKVTNVIN